MTHNEERAESIDIMNGFRNGFILIAGFWMSVAAAAVFMF